MSKPLWCIALLMTVAFPAAAVGEAAEERVASGPHLSTKEEYRSCLKARDAVETKKAWVKAEDRRIKERASKYQVASADLAAQVKKHPPGTKGEMNSYNRAIAKQRAAADDLNRASENLYKEAQALNTFVVETNSRCGSVTLSLEDAKEVEDGLSQAPKK
jgi:hypothetical protein